MAKKKVLAIPEGEIFLQREVALLKNHFDIKTAPGFNRRRPITSTFKILKGTLWADLTFCRFCGTYAFLAVLFSKIFRKKSLVFIAGHEVAKVPEIGYGSMLHPIVSHLVKFALKHADKVIAVSESLKEEAISNAKVSGENIKVILDGFEPEFWKCQGGKEDLVISVAHIKAVHVKRKGLETFVKAARNLPNVKFILVGPFVDNSINHLKSIAPPNVEFPGFIPTQELPKWYSRAKVYCQLSRHEGIPSALCEAMLCECVPVGTKYCGIPVAMGDNGFYVPYEDVEATVQAIKEALKSDKGKEARGRIKKMFSLERRKRELVSEIEGLLK